MSTQRSPKSIFIQGPVPASHIAESIAAHSAKTSIGAHSLFLGQVRADLRGEQSVVAIEYSAYESMALEKMHAIREDEFENGELTCLHVLHSLGRVAAGEVCLMIFASSPHRRAAIAAVERIVERIKAELPIWGKEVLSDSTHVWKVNT